MEPRSGSKAEVRPREEAMRALKRRGWKLVWVALVACSEAQVPPPLPAGEAGEAPVQLAAGAGLAEAEDAQDRSPTAPTLGGLPSAELEAAEATPAPRGQAAIRTDAVAARSRRRRRARRRRIHAIVGSGAAPVSEPALPQNGVLASNFVGGSGVRARLDDLLERGVVIDGQTVRLEAFQDRDPLPYERPRDEGMAMVAELERSRLRTGADRVHLQIALLGREGEAPRRPQMDVRLVLDRSGSMSGEKWTQAIAAAHGVVEALEPGDTFGLISYSDDATVDFGPAPLGDRRAAHAAIDRLLPGGGTNIGAALELAEETAPRARAGEGVGLVMLVSDGQATVGQTNPDVLAEVPRRMFDRGGVLTTSVGLGTDFDERTMLTIAREGSGSYHFVRRVADIGAILEDELQARVQAVAQGLRLRVELAEGVVARRVYGSRLLSEKEHAAVRATEVAVDRRIARELGIAQNRAQEEERGLRIHLPTFRRGDQHVVLMELEVPPGTEPTQIARVTLDYKDLIRRRNGRVVREVTALRVADPAVAQSSTVRVVKRTVLAFQAAEALQQAAEAFARGDAVTAARLLGERRELLEVGASLWRDPSLRQDAELLASYERVVTGAGDWDYASRNQLAMAMNYFGDRRMR